MKTDREEGRVEGKMEKKSKAASSLLRRRNKETRLRDRILPIDIRRVKQVKSSLASTRSNETLYVALPPPTLSLLAYGRLSVQNYAAFVHVRRRQVADYRAAALPLRECTHITYH